jgi:hypothetical protein
MLPPSLPKMKKLLTLFQTDIGIIMQTQKIANDDDDAGEAAA